MKKILILIILIVLFAFLFGTLLLGINWIKKIENSFAKIFSWFLGERVIPEYEKRAQKNIEEALSKIEEVKLEKAKPEPDMQKIQILISKAIEQGKEAEKLDPRNPEILFQMGNIYFEIREIVMGAEQWAMIYYEKALELDPDNPLYQEKLKQIEAK